MPPIDLTGRAVLVTGANRNLGLAIAREFGAHGAMVWVHGRRREAVEQAVAALSESAPRGTFRPAVADLADGDAIRRMFGQFDAADAPLSILVHSAADLGIGPAFVEMDEAMFRRVVEVNLLGAFVLFGEAARRMKAAGAGAIVNISSVAAERALHGRAAYNATKAAQDGLVRSMAVELAPFGVAVNTVAPGYIWTDRWEDLCAADLQRRRVNSPHGAPATQEEVARLVVFVASGQAPAIVGSRFVIDGGVSAQQLPADVSV